MLLAVFVCDRKEIGELFQKYDTLFIDNKEKDFGFYTLPSGKLLVLLLITGAKGHLWTTIRRWTPWKETYYRGLVGQDVEIEIVKPSKAK